MPAVKPRHSSRAFQVNRFTKFSLGKIAKRCTLTFVVKFLAILEMALTSSTSYRNLLKRLNLEKYEYEIFVFKSSYLVLI